MIKRLALLLVLAGCETTPQPIVDMQGVDPVKYSQDAAYCANPANQEFGFGNPDTRCMKAKGYKILYGY